MLVAVARVLSAIIAKFYSEPYWAGQASVSTLGRKSLLLQRKTINSRYHFCVLFDMEIFISSQEPGARLSLVTFLVELLVLIRPPVLQSG